MQDSDNRLSGLSVQHSVEDALRFSVDNLYAAGVRLGKIESSMLPPRTTFEELLQRAGALDRRIAERKLEPSWRAFQRRLFQSFRVSI
jgi:hypothetical protein